MGFIHLPRPGRHELMEPEMKYVANMHGNEVARSTLSWKSRSIKCLAFYVLSSKSLKLNVDQKVLGRELLLHLAEHLCTSYLAGDKVFLQIYT